MMKVYTFQHNVPFYLKKEKKYNVVLPFLLLLFVTII